MKFLATLQHSNIQIDWSYHFFLAYHGCSVCDITVSNCQKKFTNTMINTGVAIRNPNEVVTTIGTLKCYIATEAVIAKGDFSVFYKKFGNIVKNIMILHW